MAESVLAEKIKDGYNAMFGEENWPLWLGGLLLAILSVFAFAWGRPWGVAGGLRVWGDWILFGIGLAGKPARPLFLSDPAILTWGLLFGAFGSALMSRQWALRMAPPFELLKGLVGGALMGIGSVMAGGCNVGGFYTAVIAGSISGFAMMIGLTVGAVVGLKYLLWEIEHVTMKPPKQKAGKAGSGMDWKKVQPWLGALFFIALIGWALCLADRAYTKVGVLLLMGAGFGLVIQRCRFCFVRAFRDPFMTGESVATGAVAISIMLATAGFFIIKWAGLYPENTYIYHHWIGGLVGGFVFGVGMLLAGGCGSGSVWRAGEGHVKLIIAVLAFAITNSLFKAHVFTNAVAKSWGAPLFLPHAVTYFWGLIITLAVMLAWWLIMAWNEETDKLTMV